MPPAKEKNSTPSKRQKDLLLRYGPRAVILGASKGIGLAFAEELAAAGFSLIIAARRERELEEAATAIRGKYGVEVDAFTLDLNNPDPWETVGGAIGGRDFGLLVYNAAASPIGAFLDLNIEAAKRTVNVNISSPMELLHVVGNLFRQRHRESRRRGGIILMSSMSGLRGTPFVSAYAATKAWNTVLAEAVFAESRREGVDALACIAGATDTPGYRDSIEYQGTGAPVQKPEAVAREALRGLGKRGSMIPGLANRLSAGLVYSLLPRRWTTAIVARATSGLRKRDDAGLNR